MTAKRTQRSTTDNAHRAIQKWVKEWQRAQKGHAARRDVQTPVDAALAEDRQSHTRAARGTRRVGQLLSGRPMGSPQNKSGKETRGKSRRSLALVEAAAAILEEIQPATVRAVCYRLFTLGLITGMTKGETNRVSAQLTWAREHGGIPWQAIVDESRIPECANAWENPTAYIQTVQNSYRRDRWMGQPQRVEAWSEKGTIGGMLRPVLRKFGVTFRVMHGYGSATAVHQAAQDSVRDAKPLTILYVGDHDPSGLHMSAVDLPRRFTHYGGAADFVRLAITEADTRSGLPSFAAETKRRDARFRWYVNHYGPLCWELDALSPVLLRERVEQAIIRRIEPESWQRAEVAERAEFDSLRTILQSWPGISGQASI